MECGAPHPAPPGSAPCARELVSQTHGLWQTPEAESVFANVHSGNGDRCVHIGVSSREGACVSHGEPGHPWSLWGQPGRTAAQGSRGGWLPGRTASPPSHVAATFGSRTGRLSQAWPSTCSPEVTMVTAPSPPSHQGHAPPPQHRPQGRVCPPLSPPSSIAAAQRIQGRLPSRLSRSERPHGVRTQHRHRPPQLPFQGTSAPYEHHLGPGRPAAPTIRGRAQRVSGPRGRGEGTAGVGAEPPGSSDGAQPGSH